MPCLVFVYIETLRHKGKRAKVHPNPSHKRHTKKTRLDRETTILKNEIAPLLKDT